MIGLEKALLFNNPEIEVYAKDIKNGLYERKLAYIDPKYEFKVQYVNGAKNGGGPYFRLYYSYDEYKKDHPDTADRYYEIVSNMRHYDESMWHKQWKEKVSDFCDLEKYVNNSNTNKWKYADAFYSKTETCIEFQHSYIAWDFEERNEFYSKLNIKTVWLYDMSKAEVREDRQGNIEILEDNARGFFRISENVDNLKNNKVYIQVKSGSIYRVKELLRRDSSNEHKSTIRYFEPTEIYDEEEFVDAIRYNRLGKNNYLVEKDVSPKTIQELWNKNYSSMILKNRETDALIRINSNGKGDIFREFSTGCIKYVYVDDKYGEFPEEEKRPARARAYRRLCVQEPRRPERRASARSGRDEGTPPGRAVFFRDARQFPCARHEMRHRRPQ